MSDFKIVQKHVLVGNDTRLPVSVKVESNSEGCYCAETDLFLESGRIFGDVTSGRKLKCTGDSVIEVEGELLELARIEFGKDVEYSTLPFYVLPMPPK